MRSVHVRHKGVGRRDLVGHSKSGEEEREREEREGRLPEVEGVGDQLGGDADDEGATGAQAGGYVGDCEGAEDPAREVYEVGYGHEEGADVIGGLYVGYQGPRCGIYVDCQRILNSGGCKIVSRQRISGMEDANHSCPQSTWPMPMRRALPSPPLHWDE